MRKMKAFDPAEVCVCVRCVIERRLRQRGDHERVSAPNVATEVAEDTGGGCAHRIQAANMEGLMGREAHGG